MSCQDTIQINCQIGDIHSNIMGQITVFSAPKPFTDPHINLIQRNAIQSWVHSGEDVDVVLVGNEEGAMDVAAEYNVKFMPDVERSAWGTPLISSIFSLAKKASDCPLLVYVNADILFPPSFSKIVRGAASKAEKFLGIGYRWNVEITNPIDFSGSWTEQFFEKLTDHGYRNRSVTIDYFVFPRSIYSDVPDFAVGRSGWDNWMIYHARKMNWPVIDLTPSLKVLHQAHDYSHLPDGKRHTSQEESQVNVELGGGRKNMYTLMEATYQYKNGTLSRKTGSLSRLFRRLERIIAGPTQGGRRWWLSRRFRKLWVSIESKQINKRKKVLAERNMKEIFKD